jgi:LysR family malonate utilization transcriptional regulator
MNISPVSVHRAFILWKIIYAALCLHIMAEIYIHVPGLGNAKAGQRSDGCHGTLCLSDARGFRISFSGITLRPTLFTGIKTAPQIVQGLKNRRPELSIEFIMNSNKKLLEALNEGILMQH